MISSIQSTPTHSVSNWSNRSSSKAELYLLEPENPGFYIREIRKLVNQLNSVEGIKRVMAVAIHFPDIHWIDFQMELRGNTELSDETWEKIQDLVIDYEWKLIDDSNEEWYFRPQIVDRFYSLKDQVMVDSDDQQYTQTSRRKTWASHPLKFSVV